MSPKTLSNSVKRDDMKRRTFLTSAGGIGVYAGLAGCLERDLSTTPLQSSESFDPCPRSTIRIDSLPDAAKNEVEIALEDGFYEAEPLLYLPNVIDLQETYLHTLDPLTYYRARTDREGDVVRLAVDRTLPTHGNRNLEVQNRSDVPLDIELMIDYVEPAVSYAEVDTPKRVLSESFSLDRQSGDAPTVETSTFERLAGEYAATVVTDKNTERIEYTEPHRYPDVETGPQQGFTLTEVEGELTVQLISLPMIDDINCSDYWYGDNSPP